jgi:hypothetical protein
MTPRVGELGSDEPNRLDRDDLSRSHFATLSEVRSQSVPRSIGEGPPLPIRYSEGHLKSGGTCCNTMSSYVLGYVPL